MQIPITNILFLDIETVPQQPSFDQMTVEWRTLWNKKAENLLRNREDENAESIYPRAGIYAEFGKIICISCGFIQGSGENKKNGAQIIFRRQREAGSIRVYGNVEQVGGKRASFIMCA